MSEEAPQKPDPQKPPSGEEKLELRAFHDSSRNLNGDHENQDALYIQENAYAVFDGVGGARAGDIASGIAVEEFSRRVQGKKFKTAQEAQGALKEAFEVASKRIYEESSADQSKKGMCTTGAAVAFTEPDAAGRAHAIIANVGDSRVYLSERNGALRQLTEDDSRTNFTIRYLLRGQGKESADAAIALIRNALNNAVSKDDLERFSNDPKIARIAREDPPVKKGQSVHDWLYALYKDRGAIFNAIGSAKDVFISFNHVEVEKGDRLLLSTDGVHDNLTDEEIYQTMEKAASIDEIPDALIREAQMRIREKTFRGKDDDITAVVVVVQNAPARGLRRSEKERKVREEAPKTKPKLPGNAAGFKKLLETLRGKKTRLEPAPPKKMKLALGNVPPAEESRKKIKEGIVRAIKESEERGFPTRALQEALEELDKEERLEKEVEEDLGEKIKKAKEEKEAEEHTKRIIPASEGAKSKAELEISLGLDKVDSFGALYKVILDKTKFEELVQKNEIPKGTRQADLLRLAGEIRNGTKTLDEYPKIFQSALERALEKK